MCCLLSSTYPPSPLRVATIELYSNTLEEIKLTPAKTRKRRIVLPTDLITMVVLDKTKKKTSNSVNTQKLKGMVHLT